MSDRKWAIALTLIGFLIMASGLGMDTTVEANSGSRVFNLHLAQRQTVTMILGGVLVLVGVILGVATRIGGPKRTQPENDIAPALKRAAAEVERQQRQAARKQLAEVTQKRTESILQAVRQWFVSGSEPLAGRLLTAWFVGLCLALLAGAAAGIWAAALSFFLIFAYALRAAPSFKVQFHLHFLNFLVWSALSIATVFVFQKLSVENDASSESYISLVVPILGGTTALISLVAMAWLRLQARRSTAITPPTR